jgi:sulfonate transport system ATP-binding protein
MSRLSAVRTVSQGAPSPQASRGRITIADLLVAFGDGAARRAAVDHVSLEVAPGEFVCVLGPSGCGKSTLLNVVAGFIAPQSGTVRIDDVAISRPGADRGVVFQQPTLFPWKTVLENIAYGPKVAGRGHAEADRIARHFMAMVGLAAFADYYPQALSGGMQQRVGIARALANSPNVLLMDEPFGSLDPITKARLQQELRRLHAAVAKTILFVTHDVDEALMLGDRIAVLREGGILAQYDTPAVLLDRPADDFVAEFVGEDRALRRLALHRVGHLELDPAEPSANSLPVASAEMTLRNAVSLMLQAGSDRVLVVGDDGMRIGILPLERVVGLLR